MYKHKLISHQSKARDSVRQHLKLEWRLPPLSAVFPPMHLKSVWCMHDFLWSVSTELLLLWKMGFVVTWISVLRQMFRKHAPVSVTGCSLHSAHSSSNRSGRGWITLSIWVINLLVESESGVRPKLKRQMQMKASDIYPFEHKWRVGTLGWDQFLRGWYVISEVIWT